MSSLSASSPEATNMDVYAYCGDQLVGTSIAFLLLNIVFVALRFIARRNTSSKLALDDYLVIAALVANLAVDSLCLINVYIGGTGRHVAYWTSIQQQPEILINWGKILFSVEQTYFLAVLFAKLAILAMYIRVFTGKTTLCISYILAGVVIAAWLGSAIAGLAQCRPLWCSFDKSQPLECSCFDILAFFRYVSLPNIATDAVMLVLPLPTIWSLKLSNAQRAGLTGAFLMGSIGLVASCVRFAIFFDEDALADATWKTAYLSVWTVVEPGTYLIAACLPVLRPLVRKLKDRANTEPSSRRSKGFSNLEAGTNKYHSHIVSNKSILDRRVSRSLSDKIDLISLDRNQRQLSTPEAAMFNSKYISVTNEFNVEFHDRDAADLG